MIRSSCSSWCSRGLRGVTFAGALLALSSVAANAHANVRLEGDWADADKAVSLDVSRTPRGHAIELLAAAAGFSVVMSSPLPDLVDVHVKDQPASKVLSLLLPSGSFVAKRSGNLVAIQSVDAPVPPAPAAPPPPAPPPPAAAAPSPPAPPAPPPAPPTPPASHASRGRSSEQGEDRTVFGGALTLEKDEVANDIAVFGGALDVYGTVTGDLVVMGGTAHVHDGAKIEGSATILGGKMDVDDGAEVVHDVSVVGGKLDRGAHAKVHKSHEGAAKIADGSESVSGLGRAWRSVCDWGDDALASLSLSALLFLFGTVIVALATERSLTMRVEMAARPMRTLALGVVGCLTAAAAAVALCVTVVGIPVALLGSVVFLVAAYAGVSAVLTTVGEALLRHRTENAYVHLAAGCGLYFLVGLLPWVGKWAVGGVFLAGVGLVVATRGAGLIPARRSVSESVGT